MAGLDPPTTLYVRRNTDSSLRLWLFFALTCVGALLTVTLIRNQMHEAPPVENLESALASNELRWQQLDQHAFVHHQQLRTTFLDDAANETTDEAGGAEAAEAAEEPFDAPLVSKPTDLTPAYSYQSASIGRAVRINH